MILRYKTPVFIILITLLITAVLWSISQGTVVFSWRDIFHLLYIESLQPEQQLWLRLLIDIRIPRTLLAVIVGTVLALSGSVMQTLFRNPLAEPGLMGTLSGASLGAVIAIVLGGAYFTMVASSAFVGSLLATALAYFIGRRWQENTGLLLAGIAINTIAASIIGILTYIADDNQLRHLTFWSMGNLSLGSWHIITILLPCAFIGCLLLIIRWRALNALLLGEKEAEHLGYTLKPLRYYLIAIIAIMIGPCVAITGGISFVGLIVPHIMRMLLGNNHKYLLPACAIGGALLVVCADYLARTLISPAEIPIGLLTSLLGGPFFLYLLLKGKRR